MVRGEIVGWMQFTGHIPHTSHMDMVSETQIPMKPFPENPIEAAARPMRTPHVPCTFDSVQVWRKRATRERRQTDACLTAETRSWPSIDSCCLSGSRVMHC